MNVFELVGKITIDGIDKAQTNLDNLEKKLKNNEKAFRALAVAGGVLVGSMALISGAAIKMGMDFETAFAGVRKTVDATEEEYAVLARGIRDLAKELPTAATEIAAVAEAAGQLGIEKEAILDFSRVMIQLGQTTNLASTEAATQLARFANIVGTANDEFENLGSTVVDLGNNLATTEAEIVDMAMRIAGAGKTAGLTETQILGLAGALSSLGLRSEMGGSAIARTMLEMRSAVLGGGEELQVFADTAGMSVSQFAELFEEDATGAIMAFIEGLGNLAKSGGDTSTLLDKIGLNGIRVADTLLRAANNTTLLNEAQDLANTAWEENTALSEEAKKRYETFESQMAIVKNKVLDVAITIGKPLMSAMNSLISIASPGINLIGTLADKFSFLTVPLIALVGSGGLLLLLVGLLPKMVAGINSAIAGYKLLTGAQAKNVVVTGFHTIALVAQKAAMLAGAVATGIATAAQWAWNAALTANPIGVIIAAIGGLVAGIVLLVKHFDTVTNFIRTKLVDAFKFAADKVLWWAEKMLGWIPGLGGKIKQAREALKGMIPDKEIEESADNAEESIDQVSEATQTLIDKAKELYAGMQDTAGSIEEQAQAIAEAYSQYLDTIEELISAYNFAQTTAGKLDVTLEDVRKYLIAQGRAAELSALSMEDWVEIADDANKLAAQFSLNLQDVAYWSSLTTDRMVDNVEDYTRKAQILAHDRVEAEKDAIDDRLEAERIAHDHRMEQLDDEHDAVIASIDSQLQETLGLYDSQITDIDDQLQALADAQEQRETEARKRELEIALAREFDMEKRAELEQELNDLIAESQNAVWIAERENIYQSLIDHADTQKQKEVIAQDLADFQRDVAEQALEDKLEAEKDALLKAKDNAQEEADAKKEATDEAYEKKKEAYDAEYEALVELLENQKTALDNQLDDLKSIYDADLEAFRDYTSDKLKTTADFVNEYNELMTQLATAAGEDFTPVETPELPALPTAPSESELQSEYTDLIKVLQADYPGKPSYWYPDEAASRLAEKYGFGTNSLDFYQNAGYFAQGGLITKPTLGIIGENPATIPEIVSPVSTLREIVREELARVSGVKGETTINFNGDYYVQDEADIDIITRKQIREQEQSLSARGI